MAILLVLVDLSLTGLLSLYKLTQGWVLVDPIIHCCWNYHPALKYTFEISESSLPFLDLSVSISNNRVSTTIPYKATDTRNYLEYTSSHPTHCRNGIPFSQFLRLRRIYSDNGDYDSKSAEMASFFQYKGYPWSLITTSRQRAKGISRERALRKCPWCSISIPVSRQLRKSSWRISAFWEKIQPLRTYLTTNSCASIGEKVISVTSWSIVPLPPALSKTKHQ